MHGTSPDAVEEKWEGERLGAGGLTFRARRDYSAIDPLLFATGSCTFPIVVDGDPMGIGGRVTQMKR